MRHYHVKALLESLVRLRAVHLFFAGYPISARGQEKSPTPLYVRTLRKDAAEGEKEDVRKKNCQGLHVTAGIGQTAARAVLSTTTYIITGISH